MGRIAGVMPLILAIGAATTGTLAFLGFQVDAASMSKVEAVAAILFGALILLILFFDYVRVELWKDRATFTIREIRRPAEKEGFEDLDEE